MSKRFCEQEVTVLNAAASGSWDPALRRHLEECAACAEVALVAGFMQEAEADYAQAHLPDADRKQHRYKPGHKHRRHANGQSRRGLRSLHPIRSDRVSPPLH